MSSGWVTRQTGMSRISASVVPEHRAEGAVDLAAWSRRSPTMAMPMWRMLERLREALLAGAQRRFGGRRARRRLGLAQRALDGGDQSRQRLLGDVVVGAALHRRHRAVLAEVAGDDDDRRVDAVGAAGSPAPPAPPKPGMFQSQSTSSHGSASAAVERRGAVDPSPGRRVPAAAQGRAGAASRRSRSRRSTGRAAAARPGRGEADALGMPGPRRRHGRSQASAIATHHRPSRLAVPQRNRKRVSAGRALLVGRLVISLVKHCRGDPLYGTRRGGALNVYEGARATRRFRRHAAWRRHGLAIAAVDLRGGGGRRRRGGASDPG